MNLRGPARAETERLARHQALALIEQVKTEANWEPGTLLFAEFPDIQAYQG